MNCNNYCKIPYQLPSSYCRNSCENPWQYPTPCPTQYPLPCPTPCLPTIFYSNTTTTATPILSSPAGTGTVIIPAGSTVIPSTVTVIQNWSTSPTNIGNAITVTVIGGIFTLGLQQAQMQQQFCVQTLPTPLTISATVGVGPIIGATVPTTTVSLQIYQISATTGIITLIGAQTTTLSTPINAVSGIAYVSIQKTAYFNPNDRLFLAVTQDSGASTIIASGASITIS